jgi:hypothetical protein
MVFGTWDLNFGVWEILGYGFQDMVFGTWDLNFGAWEILGYGFQDMVFGTWDLNLGLGFSHRGFKVAFGHGHPPVYYINSLVRASVYLTR